MNRSATSAGDGIGPGGSDVSAIAPASCDPDSRSRAVARSLGRDDVFICSRERHFAPSYVQVGPSANAGGRSAARRTIPYVCRLRFRETPRLTALRRGFLSPGPHLPLAGGTLV